MRYHELINELSQADRKKKAGVVSDQFFTRPEVAKKFAGWIKSQSFMKQVDRMIEPSAGNGDLAAHFPGIEKYDLDPKSSDIKQQDFLDSDHQHTGGTLVVMNPPFGAGSDLAIKFFNKAATFASYIAQIVPRTFRRSSIQDRLHREWHLVDEYVLPKNSFYLPQEGADKGYDVPAVAQIWELVAGKEREPNHVAELPVDTHFIRDPNRADFAFRRKGRRAGQLITDPQQIAQTNPNSFFYIQGPVDRWAKVNWNELGHDVMGARSISKSDIANALAQI